MPFWVLEGFILVSSLIVLIFAVVRYRRGFLERIDEHVGLAVTLWCLTIPFVIFQALISARDDGFNVTAMQAVAPIVALLGFFTWSFTALACRVRTPFQLAREERERAMAGSRILFQV